MRERKRKWLDTLNLQRSRTKRKITIQEENGITLRGEVISVEWNFTENLKVMHLGPHKKH